MTVESAPRITGAAPSGWTIVTARRRRGFSIIEMLVALLIASVGIGGIINLFVNVARAADRDARRAQSLALGRGLIATWQRMPRDKVLRWLGEGQQVWPESPLPFETIGAENAPQRWQWRWQGPLPGEGSIALELLITSEGVSGEALRLPAIL